MRRRDEQVDRERHPRCAAARPVEDVEDDVVGVDVIVGEQVRRGLPAEHAQALLVRLRLDRVVRGPRSQRALLALLLG